MKKLCLLVCMSLGLSAAAVAKGDAEAGKAKSAVCAACHGPDGNSMIDMNPKLAGQHEKYLVKQLTEFKLASQTGGEEGRNNAVMNGMAAPLSTQDMEDLAAYFSSQEATPGETAEQYVEAGKALYQGGDEERGITACIACHGPQGNGSSLSGFPDISGQHATYTASQLKSFRSGQRHNSMNGMMRDIAMKLTDEDIEILSNYVSGLH
ncbi:MAG: c-type cytochrome [Alteromonas sp.]|jgi:cytochrome c553|uniref:c-type cytochrome n=1 Tax=Alteromonas sp. TaxID=232 RepID=UPI000B728985|nr:c-type cytochrome [Alteromonas sp.]MAI39072.1 cytochrome c4 [Alteromonas sp.]|tara:strand:- start:13850 stop:14473 length:624 start_codon:yes stop_codon:yes gene_type:complete